MCIILLVKFHKSNYLEVGFPLSLKLLKAKTHDATNRSDTSPRQVAATNRLVWHVKIIVAATEFCCCNLSRKFKLVWICATYRSNKLSASNLSQQQCRGGDLPPRLVTTSCVSALRVISLICHHLKAIIFWCYCTNNIFLAVATDSLPVVNKIVQYRLATLLQAFTK